MHCQSHWRGSEAWRAGLPASTPGPRGTARPVLVQQSISRHRLLIAAASTPATGSEPDHPKEGTVARLLRPLRDFGFGRTSAWEGGVGLFILTGVGFAFVLISWARGGALGRRGKGYECTLEFPQACGISTGTPVRIRGVPVGSAVRVQPSLEKVEVECKITDTATVIPRNSLIEANQSGLIAEPLIDIMPQLPIPAYEHGPLDSRCEAEGKIVCNKGHLQGLQGVSMDDLVYVCTKIARQMDTDGLDKMFEAAASANTAIEEGRPLLQQASAIAREVIPLMQQLRQGGLMGNLEELTRSASAAATDIHRLQNEVLTPDNVASLRDSVATLTRTLEHIEGISGDVGGLTGDNKTKHNVKQLVESLSRIVAD